MTEFVLLEKVGLSKTAVICYKSLLEKGPATTRRLSHRLNIPQTNLYGVLKSLTEQGFIDCFKMTTQPALFIAWPLDQALQNQYMNQRQILLPLCRELGVQPPVWPRRNSKLVA